MKSKSTTNLSTSRRAPKRKAKRKGGNRGGGRRAMFPADGLMSNCAVRLPASLLKELRERAKSNKTNPSELIRRAVLAYLTPRPAPSRGLLELPETAPSAVGAK